MYILALLFCRPRDGHPQVLTEDQETESDLQNLMQVN